MKTIRTILSLFFLLLPLFSFADKVDITNVQAIQNKDKTWRFDVTLKHQDDGWDHYANQWQVIAPDNKILATRTLYHPHVKEQPFTRSLQSVKIPNEIGSVRVIARDTVHGLSKNMVEINLSTHVLKTHKLGKTKDVKDGE